MPMPPAPALPTLAAIPLVPQAGTRDIRAMLTATAARGFAWLAHAMEAASDAAGPSHVDRLAATGRAYLAFARAYPEHYRLMFGRGDIATDDPEFRSESRRAFQVLIDHVAAASRVMPDAAMPDVLLAWAVVHGFATLIEAKRTPLSDEQMETVIPLVLGRLAQAIGSRSAA